MGTLSLTQKATASASSYVATCYLRSKRRLEAIIENQLGMGEKYTNSFEKCANCFVLLKRLDKHILARHLQKRRPSSKGEDIAKQRRHDEREESRDRSFPKHRKTERSHEDVSGEDSENSALKGDLIRRKRKTRAKPFRCADDGDQVLQETGGANSGAAPSEGVGNPENESDSGTSDRRVEEVIKRSGKCSENLTYKASISGQGSSEGSFGEFPFQPHVEKCEIPGNDRLGFADEMDATTNGEEKDKVMRYPPTAEEWGKHIKLERDADDPGERQKSAEEDCDLRDEDEDDRATVIFEASFDGGATDFYEVLEEIRSVKRKFGKKKITNRKKRTLVKFKRKRRSMIGRNIARVKKVRNTCSEVGGSRRQRAEKAGESIFGECYLREVCGLIKRLHELYRIILQLQEDLPKDSEHAEHFKRTINVQQENLCKEIKKHGKTVIGGYERMVKCYGNVNTVSREIGKRTSLTKEDIANVISRCTPKGELSLEKGRTPPTEEPEPDSSLDAPPKPFAITPTYSTNLKKLIDDKIEAIFLTETAHSVKLEKSTAPEQQHPSLPRQPGPVDQHPPPQSLPAFPSPPAKSSPDFTMARDHPAGENPAPAPSLSSHFFRGSLSQSDNYQWQWAPHSKARPHFYPQRIRGPVRDPRHPPQLLTRFNPRYVHGNHPQSFPPRPVHDLSPNFRPRPQGLAFPAPPYPPDNGSTIGLFHAGFVPLPAPGRTTLLPIPPLMDFNPYPSGHNLGRLPLNQSPHVPNPSSLSSTDVRPAPPQHDFGRYSNMPSHSPSQKYSSHPRRRQVFPSPKGLECSVDGAPEQAFPREGQCSLRTILSTFSMYLQPNASQRKYPTQIPAAPADPEETSSPSTTPATASEKLARCILDPTVPQKLTMRNRRLEAGPVLETAGEGWKYGGGGGGGPSRWQRPPTEEATSKDDGGGSAQKESNSRVYVCAENGCKKPGVRICKACRSVIYCGEACQLKHWITKHKSECHQLKELRG